MDINFNAPWQKVGGILMQFTKKFQFSAAEDRTSSGLEKTPPRHQQHKILKNFCNSCGWDHDNGKLNSEVDEKESVITWRKFF